MKVQFDKDPSGLVPAIIQDKDTAAVLMLGYMNREALKKTLEINKVTFYSRSRKRLWTKGEESGNFLHVHQIMEDCDRDTLLIRVTPEGPVCHTGSDTCWGEENPSPDNFLEVLETIIDERRHRSDSGGSYVGGLFRKGINAIAQKVGEEAVETIIEAKDSDDSRFLNESADLLFHYLILLNAKGYALRDVAAVLRERHQARSSDR